MKTGLSNFCFSLALATAIAVGADAPTTTPAAIALPDLQGISHRPLELSNAPAAVIIFVGVDCPVSNSYAPLINHLCEQYAARGVRFYLVHAERGLSIAAARKHAKEFGYTCPILLDQNHALATALGATVTPEAAIIGPGGRLCYRGRIDDWYVTLGKPRYEATTHDLRDALDAMLAGKDVATARTTAIGCTIGD